MFQIGIITSPRKDPTLNSMLTSLRKVGYKEKVFIYSEPQELTVKDQNVEIKMNDKQLGCFGNFNNALNDLIKVSPHEFICVFSDDFIFSSRMFSWIRHSWDGYYALYTPKGIRNQFQMKRGWNKINEGWANIWGGNYMMCKAVAEMIIKHPFYQDHLKNYETNQQIDHCIPEVCHQLKLNQYFHNPSLTNHIGIESTIGHKHSTHEEGLNFRK